MYDNNSAIGAVLFSKKKSKIDLRVKVWYVVQNNIIFILMQVMQKQFNNEHVYIMLNVNSDSFWKINSSNLKD